MELNYQIRTLFDRRKKATATIKGSVEIEIYFNRKRVRMATGVMVLKQQWKLGHVVNHPDAESLNRRIQEMSAMLDERMKTMSRQGYIDLEALKSDKVAQTAKVSSGNFIEWLHERIMKRPVAESTRRQHLVMLEDLKKFGRIVNFSDLTTRNIMLWNDQLQERLNTQSSVHGYHKRLKPYITEALQFELIKENPYDHIRIKRGKSTTIKFLSTEERIRIEELELFGPTEKARDMFIFSCYTGLSHADLIKIKKEDVKKEGEDYIINDFRQKTGSEYNIMLLPPAMKILRKYNFNLNLMSNQKCNDQLKLIAQMAGIHINLTMHVGRHTFATWALTEGVDIATVSKMLAHANVSTTEIYARPWPGGNVDNYLPREAKRQVTLTRYCKINRVVPDEEVARMIVDKVSAYGVSDLPYNIFPDHLRKAIEDAGMPVTDETVDKWYRRMRDGGVSEAAREREAAAEALLHEEVSRRGLREIAGACRTVPLRTGPK